MTNRRTRTRAVRAVFVVLFSLFALTLSQSAEAYPWTVKHGYVSCGQCHLDPSGGGLLTPYGRAQGEILLRTHFKERPADWEPGKSAQFLWGAIKLPDAIQLGGSSRTAELVRRTEGGPGILDPSARVIYVMQADLRAQVKVWKLRGYGSIAFIPFGARAAAITSRETLNVVSREHWIGLDIGDNYLLRAGRVALPFGIRNIEHTMWARAYTRTDISSDQQHGLSLAYNGEAFRAELMGVAGNYQVRPAVYRELGYAGYAELTVASTIGVGLSSMSLTSELDIERRVARRRQAHGLTARAGLGEKLVIMTEANILLDAFGGGRPLLGSVGYVQSDYEVIQGLHIQGTFEWLDEGGDGARPSYGGWLSVTWFVLPHVDVRLDIIERWIVSGSGTTRSDAFVGQLHFYL